MIKNNWVRQITRVPKFFLGTLVLPKALAGARIFLLAMALGSFFAPRSSTADGFDGAQIFKLDRSLPEINHWESEIVFGVIGDATQDSALFAIAQVMVWADLARVDATYFRVLPGFALSEKPRADELNYLIYFAPAGETMQQSRLKLDAVDVAPDSATLSESLQGLLEGGLLPFNTDGCFTSAMGGEENVILAGAISIDLSLSPEAQRSCLELGVVSIFGVAAQVYERQIRLSGTPSILRVKEYVETHLLLSSAAACMKDGKLFDIECPFTVARHVLSDVARGLN